MTQIGRLWCSFLCLVMWITGTGSWVAPAQAQFGNVPVGNDEVVLFAPRSLTRLLREGEEALAQRRYSDAIAALGALFDDQDPAVPEDIRGQDYFLEAERPDSRSGGQLGYYQKTLRGEALRLLSEVPQAGRDLLEIEYGVPARQQLEAALDQGDFQAVADVARRYPFTFAGYDAQMLMAREMFAKGSPLGAAAVFQRLLDYPAARNRYGTELAKAAAISWLCAGLEEAAVRALELSSRLFQGQSVELGGQQLVFAPDTDWKAAISSFRSADRSLPWIPSPEDWMLAGGSPARHAEVDISLPTATARWVAKTHGSVPEKNALLALATAEEDGDRVVLPKAEVRAVGDLVLVKTTDAEILAIDLKTGLTKWVYYENSAPADLLTPTFSRNGRNASSSISNELKNRVWGSSAYGRFSCDEQRIYYVTEGERPPSSRNRFRGAVPGNRTNQLQAVSIAKEGALEWVIGNRESPDQEAAGDVPSDIFFLGPPLSFEARLYCIADVRGDTKLVVLDAENGTELWSQQLCTSFTQAWQVDSERKSQALSPTISDGVIVCPTGVGALAAVDLLTHNLRWLVSYGTEDRRANQFGGGALYQASEFDPLADRWHDNAVIAKDGMVVVSPVEQDVFFVRNILTGQSVLERRKRDFGRYVAGLSDYGLVIVGKHNVYCLDLETQSIVWDREFPDDRLLCGKGLWLKDSLLLPLSGNKLVRYALEDGRPLEEAEVDQPVGNLFAHRGNLISVSATDVSIYYTRDQLQRTVSERLAKDANDVDALNQKAQLAYAVGNIDEAFEILRQSFELNSDNAETSSMLVEILLAGLESDFAKYESIAKDLRPVVEDHPKRAGFLQWLALGSLRAREFGDAFENLLAFMRERLNQNTGISASRSAELRISDSYTVDADTWIATELARCYQRATTEERQQMQDLVAKELEAVEQLILSQRRMKLKYFAWHPAAESGILDTAVALSQEGEQITSEQMLIPLLQSEQEKTRELASKLLERWTDDDLSRFGPRGQFLSSIYNDQGQLSAPQENQTDNLDPKQPIRWNSGKVVFAAIRERGIYPRGNRLPTISERYGRPPVEVRLSSDEIILANDNGEIVQSLRYARASSDNSSMFNRCYLRGALLIVETSSEVAGLDMHLGLQSPRDALLWRKSLLTPSATPQQRFMQPSPNSIDTSFGVEIHQRETAGSVSAVGPLTPGGLVLQKGSTISCIDPYSGRTMWSRDGYDGVVQFAAKGLELAVLSSASGLIEYLDCRDGAERERSRKVSGDVSVSNQRNQVATGTGDTWNPWFSHGAMLVEYQEKQAVDSQNSRTGIAGRSTRRPVIRVWNAVLDKSLAELDQLPMNSRAAACEDRFLVVADQQQKLHFFDLQEETYRVWNVAVDSELQSIAVERFGNRLLVMCNNEKSNAELTELSQRNRMLPQEFCEIHGKVYAIDIEQADLSWRQPAELYGLYLPINQPRNSPFMISYRFNPRRAGESTVLALLDLRDGKLAYANRRVPVDILGGFAMLLHPKSQLIEMSLGNRNFIFRCTELEKPPQPIARYGHIQAPDDDSRLKGFDIFKQ